MPLQVSVELIEAYGFWVRVARDEPIEVPQEDAQIVLREHTGDVLAVAEKDDAICSAMFDATPDRQTDVYNRNSDTTSPRGVDYSICPVAFDN